MRTDTRRRPRGSAAAKPYDGFVAKPHDGLFRMAFSDLEVARAQLESQLPPMLLAKMDLSAIQIQSSAFVDTRLTQSFADLMYRVPLRDGEEEVFIYPMVEHQSTVPWLMMFRLLSYQVQVWEAHVRRAPHTKTLPMIIPMVVSQSAEGWDAPTEFQALYAGSKVMVALWAEYLVYQTVLLDDLSLSTEEELAARSASAYARLVWWSLRNHGNTDHARKLAWIEEFKRLMQQQKTRAAEAIVKYHLSVSKQQYPPVGVEAAMEASETLKEYALTCADQLRSEGHEKGHKEGHRKGRKEGRKEGRRKERMQTLVRQIHLKFPNQLTPELQAKIQQASNRTILRWTSRIITESSLLEVLD